MQLRPYQKDAVDSVFQNWKNAASTLVVLPTGCGKTICFAEVIRRLPYGCRAMVIAHREELIFQAADKIERVIGEKCAIEMAEYRADAVHRAALFEKEKAGRIVVSSVQTQNAGQTARMERFDPRHFSVLIIDEAHHATADSYRRVIEHFRKNPELRVLGVTATPDRTDEEALGQIFETVAADYEIQDAIHDGWLVPIDQRSVSVAGLDLSTVRTTAGDLNGADLARVMEYEQNLHEIAAPTIELAQGRKTLVFAASVAHAERLCEIFNRHQPNCARWVCGNTPKDERRGMFADYAAGKFQILCNVGVATEGFDEPGIRCIVMARPTKSRALYAQMVGRGTRPLAGLVDRYDEADDRRMAIAESDKPSIEIIDFVGNAGKHKLVGAADILGGRYSEEVIELARTKAAQAGRSVPVLEALEDAQKEIHEERERERERERAQREKLRVRANYSTSSVDPFDVFHLERWAAKGWEKNRAPSEKMLAMLEKQGIKTEHLSYTQCRQLIAEIFSRWDKDQCSYKQSRLLQRYGYPGDLSRNEAKTIIDALAKNNWQRPAGADVPATTPPPPVTVY